MNRVGLCIVSILSTLLLFSTFPIMGQADELVEETIEEIVAEKEFFTISGTIIAEGSSVNTNYTHSVFFKDGTKPKQTVIEAVYGYDNDLIIGNINWDGTYSINVPKDTHTLQVYVPGHVSETIHIEIDQDMIIDFRSLRAGDVTGDNKINLVDLNRAAREFGRTYTDSEPWSIADLNQNHVIDILDISYILNNFQISNRRGKD